MKERIDIIMRVSLIMILLMALPLLVLSNLLLREESQRATEKYQLAQTELQDTTEKLSHVERRLGRLTTSVGAVESEVRRTLRMVKPGETFVLVERGE